jgi:hypothetical protein
VTHPLFGERYFATRERLSEVIHGIVALAKTLSADPGDLIPIREMQSDLGAPFRWVVCGEVNAGKSSLINGLFGCDLCRVNPLPETHRILWYQYGDTAHEVASDPLMEEHFQPFAFLRNFHLIDTPGTNSGVKGHPETIARFLPSSDLIFCVFPVSNPWGPATWNFISKLTPETLKRAVIILQQADQCEPADLAVILGHVADLSMKRLGWVPPIFPVSAKLACEAKGAVPWVRHSLQASGYPDLERFLSNQIHESESRKKTLETWRARAAAGLRTVEDHLEDQNHALSTHGRFLDTLEREIDEIREQFVARLTGHLTGVAEIFESEAIWVTRCLRRRLGVIPSFFRLFIGDRTGAAMESIFIARLQSAVETVAENDGVEVVGYCRKHWDALGERVKSAMAVDIGNSDPLDEILTIAKKHFIQRISRAARDGIDHLKVRNQLDKELRRRNAELKSVLVIILVSITGGATSGALGLPWLPLILCSLAGLFLTGGVVTAMRTRYSITKEFQKRLLDTCGSFAGLLRADYEEALRVVFQDYASSLTAVRGHLVREKLAVAPRLKRWQELFLTLKAIEQDL